MDAMPQIPPGTYYQSSGKAPALGVLIALVIGCAAGFVLAIGYGYLLVYIPIAGYVTFLFAAGFGGVTGFATSMGLKFGKVRNRTTWGVVVVVVSLFTFYAGWAWWMYALLRRGGADVSLADVFSPGQLWSLVLLVNEKGAWSMKGWTPTGIVLWILWLIEAAIIFGSLFMFSGILTPPDPFCERCTAWCQEHEGVAFTSAPTDPAALAAEAPELKRQLEQKDFSRLEALGPPVSGEPFFRLDQYHCETCDTIHLLSLNHIHVEYDEKGGSKEDVTPMLEHLMISRQEAEEVRKIGDRLAAARLEAAKEFAVTGTEPPPDGGEV